MALDKDRLGTAIKNAIDAMTTLQKSDIEYVWQAISECFINEFTTNGVVTTDVDGTDYTGEIS
jgi:hypothetical protein